MGVYVCGVAVLFSSEIAVKRLARQSAIVNTRPFGLENEKLQTHIFWLILPLDSVNTFTHKRQERNFAVRDMPERFWSKVEIDAPSDVGFGSSHLRYWVKK